MYATTKQEHDEGLRKIFERLSQKGLNLNKGKYKIDMDKMAFNMFCQR